MLDLNLTEQFVSVALLTAAPCFVMAAFAAWRHFGRVRRLEALTLATVLLDKAFPLGIEVLESHDTEESVKYSVKLFLEQVGDRDVAHAVKAAGPNMISSSPVEREKIDKLAETFSRDLDAMVARNSAELPKVIISIHFLHAATLLRWKETQEEGFRSISTFEDWLNRAASQTRRGDLPSQVTAVNRERLEEARHLASVVLHHDPIAA
ncbi:MAG: hypothetical protein B7Y80_00675 [Hyphomicrobium sp. 32-62-53]|nr:MAG: hypothetical protein B7Z29_13995 [Hyphomicrobium sp. 12-62-95]OYY01862.1 MAG: hypothetical protein B7Y80_00675 [Hyphomicrobium sp. 32-62-53]